MHEIDKKVTPTEIIMVEDLDNIETELRELSKAELLHRLNYEEHDPKTLKLIRKILKEKV